MSIGLTLYVVNRKEFEREEISPSHILTLDETYLTEFFIEREGSKFVQTLPENKKLYVLTRDEEMPSLVNQNLYGNKIEYIDSTLFITIPKDIIKKESRLVKAAIKFIKKLPECIVILYYT